MTDNVLDIPVKKIDGSDTTLADYRGKVIMVVNVASKCGLTVQYEGLEKLYEDKRDEGFVIAGFPANDFKGQEPGTNEDILSFCTLTYDVQFPMFSKIAVTGEERHPLYDGLIASGVETTGDGPMRERLAKHGLETGQDGDSGFVSVEDSGIGIDPRHHERVFDRFYRVQPARGDKSPGLGLSIVRAVAMAHGGRVALRSVPDLGSIFRVDLPRAGVGEHEIGAGAVPGARITRS